MGKNKLAAIEIYPQWFHDLESVAFCGLHSSAVRAMSKKSFGAIRPDDPVNSINGLSSFRYWDKKHAEWFYWPFILHSAGHAELDIEKSKVTERVIHKDVRPKNSCLLSDSGGFQIATGALKLKHSFDNYAKKAQAWQEEVSDYAMTLDIPPIVASQQFKDKQKAKDKEYWPQFKTFDDCLDKTVQLLKAYDKPTRRKDNCKYLNCVHGSNGEEVTKWLKKTKFFKGSGYALASMAKLDPVFTLETVLRMRDMKLLDGKDLIHILGVGTVYFSLFATTLQRGLLLNGVRGSDGKGIRVSIDNATSSIKAGKFSRVFLSNNNLQATSPFRLNCVSMHELDAMKTKHGKMHRDDTPSPILQNVDVSEILSPKWNKKKKRHSADGITTCIGYVNNVYMQLRMWHEAHKDVYQIMPNMSLAYDTTKYPFTNTYMDKTIKLLLLVERAMAAENWMDEIQAFNKANPDINWNNISAYENYEDLYEDDDYLTEEDDA